jgi:hypothetical protein
MPDSTSASTSRPSEPSPSEPVEPTLPAAAEGDDAAAAEAFVRHYYDYVNYAQATGDTKGLRKLALSSCVPCEGGAAAIEKVYTSGGSITGGNHSVRVLRSERGAETQSVQSQFLKVRVSNTEQRVRGTESDLDGTYPAADIDLVFRLLRASDWQIAGWRAVE